MPSRPSLTGMGFNHTLINGYVNVMVLFKIWIRSTLKLNSLLDDFLKLSKVGWYTPTLSGHENW